MAILLGSGIGDLDLWANESTASFKSKKRVGAVLVILTLGFSVWLGYPNKSIPTGGLKWVEWSPELEKSLRAEGKAVYVDFTAKWCLSCQVNKRVFLYDDVVDF